MQDTVLVQANHRQMSSAHSVNSHPYTTFVYLLSISRTYTARPTFLVLKCLGPEVFWVQCPISRYVTTKPSVWPFHLWVFHTCLVFTVKTAKHSRVSAENNALYILAALWPGSDERQSRDRGLVPVVVHPSFQFWTRINPYVSGTRNFALRAQSPSFSPKPL